MGKYLDDETGVARERARFKKNYTILTSKDYNKLSDNEKKSLNTLCKGAALRYLLTRVYDYLNTPKNVIIKIKNFTDI